MIDLNDLQRRMDGAVASMKNDFAALRTGRASASLLDSVMVEAYGQAMPINQVGTVTVPEPRMVAVQIWDKSMVGAADKAIRESDLGLNPIVDGTNLRIPLPELNEERRKELVKVAHQYAEQARIAVRHVRKDGMDELKKLEKEGDMGEDESRSGSDKVQKHTDDTINIIDETLATKEKEILQV